MGKVYGYVRVSSTDQHEAASQRLEILRAHKRHKTT